MDLDPALEIAWCRFNLDPALKVARCRMDLDPTLKVPGALKLGQVWDEATSYAQDRPR